MTFGEIFSTSEMKAVVIGVTGEQEFTLILALNDLEELDSICMVDIRMGQRVALILGADHSVTIGC